MRAARAIIFDLDGTLADTLRDIADAGNAALASAGLPPHTLSNYRRAVGSGVPVLLQTLSGMQDSQRLADMVRVFRDHYSRHGLDHTRLYPGIPGLLNRISRAGLPMSVLSNKPHEYTVRMVEALCSAWPFAGVLGEGDGRPRKPDPTGALELARRMNRRPAAVAFVGDSDIDMHTARSAGMRAVGVTWGFRDREVIEAAGAHDLIQHPKDLLPLIDLKSS